MAEEKHPVLNALKRYAQGAVYSQGVLSQISPGDASKVKWSESDNFKPESTIVSSIQDFIANDIATQTYTHEKIDAETMVRSNRLDSPIYELLNINIKDGQTNAEFWTGAIKKMLRDGWVYITPVYKDADKQTYQSMNLVDLVIEDARPDDLSHTIAIKSPYNKGLQAKKLLSKAYELLWADMGDNDMKGILKVNGQIDQKTGKFTDQMKATMDALYQYVPEFRIGVMDYKTDYTELSNDYRKIKPEDLTLLEDEVYAVFGVNKDVIMGNATPEQMKAYKEKVIGPINRQIKTELNRVLLSSYLRTLTSEKSTIEHIGIYENPYQYASLTEIAQVIQQATNAGIAKRNELRDILGLPPEENGDELVTNLNNVRIGQDGQAQGTEQQK